MTATERGGSGRFTSALRAVPGVRAVTTYRREWLSKDIVAGVVLTTLLVPQGMAYAELAGLPAITGLYTSILCLLAYAVCGPSRILVLGPDSSLGPMIAATVLPLVAADGDPARAVALASMLAIMVAAIMILASLARLGYVAELISKPTMIGYMNGLALTILIGQLPKLLGFKTDADGLIDQCAAVVQGLADGRAVPAAVAVGCGGLVLILALQHWLPRVPAVLVMVVLAIAAVVAFDLGARGVSLVGVLPEGFPPLTLPRITLDDLGPLLAGALGIAVVSLADTISNASAFASRTGQEVRGNQEMAGVGAANLAAGLFQGFPVSTSGSRTAVAERAGARTQLTGVVGAALIVLMLVLVPGLFRHLPQPALAAVVITASLSLADVPGTVRLWRQRRVEFLLCVAAFLGVALIGVLEGIAVAVALSVLNVFRRAWWPYETVLGRVDGLPGYHDIRSHPSAAQIPGLVIYRFDAPLFFANARTFRDEVLKLARTEPEPAWIVIAAEPMTDVDTTAADVLEGLDETLNARGTHLVFAELKDPVRRKIERYELTRTIDARHFFPTVEAAVTAFRHRAPEDGSGVTAPDGRP
ncbi:SulP family inorganic anion transporter [Streptomyces sp. NPDC004111]|uniref:SulP family inorganic anion transporter n=1 Tax=Streptomyces sp. NPDC004111 TaxID=3364690 RepID=UPI0036B14663